MRGEVVYPGESREIPGVGGSMYLPCQEVFKPGTYILCWKLFLDNSPPCAGEIDLGAEIEEARKSSANDRPTDEAAR
jgi:hypothetical protein